jgi:DNA-binding transcriptional LysR family regulator
MDSQVFPAIALAYLHAFPNVRLATQACEEAPRLLRDGVDAAIVVGALPDSSEFAIALGMVRPIVVAAPDYLARWGRPVSPDDLKSHRTVTVSSPGHEGQWRFPSGGSNRTVRTGQVLSCSTQRGAIHAATLGVGLMRCMSYQVHEELSNGVLEPVLSSFVGEGVPVQLIYRHGRRAEARVRTFIDFATPLLRAHPAFTG